MAKKRTTAVAPAAPNYTERADNNNRKVMRRLIDAGMTDFDAGVAEIQSGTKAWIRGCNKIREAGRKFAEAEDINQFEFKNLFAPASTADWKQQAIQKAKIDAAKKVFRSMATPAAKFEDCKAVIQLVLVAAGDLDKPRRLEAQNAHEPPNPWNEIVSQVAGFETIYASLTKNKPMDHWERDELEKFISTTKPVKDEHDRAAALLEKCA